MAAGSGLQATDALARRTGRLAVGVLAIAAIAYGLAQAGRLPGSAGEMLRANIEADRDTTALFYTEVDGWQDGFAPYVAPPLKTAKPADDLLTSAF